MLEVPPVLYADFEPGGVLGTERLTVDERMFAQWTALFPADAQCAPSMPPGMTAMVVMRAYMHVITPRPPGNIHAQQRFEVHRLPCIGDTVSTSIRCSDKEVRNKRNWVYLVSETRDAKGELLFTGYMTTIWAA